MGSCEVVVALIALAIFQTRMAAKAELAPSEPPSKSPMMEYDPLFSPIVPVCSASVYTDANFPEQKRVALNDVLYTTYQIGSKSYYKGVFDPDMVAHGECIVTATNPGCYACIADMVNYMLYECPYSVAATTIDNYCLVRYGQNWTSYTDEELRNGVEETRS